MNPIPLLIFLLPIGSQPPPPATGGAPSPKTLRFSGYEWVVRGSGKGGPGPNEWSEESVRLDDKGHLHLKIRRVRVPATATAPARDEWRCAEVHTRLKLGHGEYTFEVVGAIDRLDPNIVLGLFDYPAPGDGADGTNEIDIEFARWGNPRYPNGNYTIYPADGPRDPNASHTFRFRFDDSSPTMRTTHRFRRENEGVRFQFFRGTAKKGSRPWKEWEYRAPFHRAIPQQALPVHINLWLFQGRPPTDNQETEIVIRSFSFVPSP
ncbi:MAG: glycoside hydrolase family 16 protein [Capsulimonadales bacterium]|nr:glycoside hydrolase family 16 protein [Capsulimonadales bacterium]